jgi:hypothetical protein
MQGHVLFEIFRCSHLANAFDQSYTHANGKSNSFKT